MDLGTARAGRNKNVAKRPRANEGGRREEEMRPEIATTRSERLRNGNVMVLRACPERQCDVQYRSRFHGFAFPYAIDTVCLRTDRFDGCNGARSLDIREPLRRVVRVMDSSRGRHGRVNGAD